MLPILSLFLTLAASAGLLLSLMFCGEIAAGLFYRYRTAHTGTRPEIAVLIPAHDEESTLGSTLVNLQTELRPGDRVLVVADNCSDRTAEVAKQHGARVVQRRDDLLRGKGYALAAGVEALANEPPDAVVILDADCSLAPGSLEQLALEATSMGYPTQALYLMETAKAGEAAVTAELRDFAWLIKNKARPLGLAALGLPCQLMGTGMAFRWSDLREARLATGNLVEDLQLGLDFALAGKAARFCPEARVFSAFPSSPGGDVEQRRRWEHGHLALITERAPTLLRRALHERNWPLFSLVLDLCVPPLALFVQVLIALLALSSGLWFMTGDGLPLLVAVFSIILFTLGLGVGWYAYGRSVLPLRAMLGVPEYLLRKVPIYSGFLMHRQETWVRTKRG